MNNIITLAALAMALSVAAALSGCGQQSGYTEEEKAQITKRCNDAGKIPDIHENWSVCRSPAQFDE